MPWSMIRVMRQLTLKVLINSFVAKGIEGAVAKGFKQYGARLS